jgi:deoxyribonuclease V
MVSTNRSNCSLLDRTVGETDAITLTRTDRSASAVCPRGVTVTGFDGMDDLVGLEREQLRLAASSPPMWSPGPGPLVIGGVFVAFARGEQGPGRAGDRAVVGAAATEDTEPLASVVVDGRAMAPYHPGVLAAREGALLEAAARALGDDGVELDVLLVDATGRDHPRRAGLALHLGEVLGLPTVGVTHRPLLACGLEPAGEVGSWTELTLDGDVVGRWVRTRPGVRPLAVHSAWRTDPATAMTVVLRATATARTPEPLRLARTAAREARSERAIADRAD